MTRPDRKATAQLLSAKGLSTREIATITGWHHTTIAEDLKALKPVGKPEVGNPTDEDGEEAAPPEATKEEVPAAVEAAESEPTFETIVLDLPWPMSAKRSRGGLKSCSLP